MSNLLIARRNMVENQIRANKVTDDRIIAAFNEIPREDFVPAGKESVAYVDEDLSLGSGRYLMEPMVLARLLQEALVDADDIVLDVGCCTGYSTAIISRVATSVIGVDDSQDAIDSANDNLARLEIDNAGVVLGSLRDGYAQQMPYTFVIISGAVEEVPDPLFDQLVDGGRLAAVLKKDEFDMGKATIFHKIKNKVSSRYLFDAGTPSLPGFFKQEVFHL